MECPKCGLEIDDKALVCPNCKKVLKLVCPVCKTINTNNTCKKCGYVIITKCSKCGKINQTFSQKCKKCGFSTEKSVILNEANTDEFVMLTMTFPNLDELKTLLGSAKLYNKFKVNLDKIISEYTNSVGLRRQFLKNTYVIRCLKDYTFTSSARTATETAIELLNRITTMNAKLSKRKDVTVRCSITLMTKKTSENPNKIESGYNVTMLRDSAKSKEEKVMNTFQVITDAKVFDVLSKEYDLSPLNSVMIDGEMKMFYEMDIKNLVHAEFEPDEEEEQPEIPNFVQNMLIEQDKLDGIALNNLDKPNDPDAIYDVETINFEEINAEFIRTQNIDIFNHLENIWQTKKKCITSLKTAELYKPYSLKLVNAIEETGQYNNIIALTCYEEMKFEPFAFFRSLISAIFEYTVSQKLFSQNDFTMFANIDPEGLIRDLVTLTNRKPEDCVKVRFKYFDLFLTLLQAIPNTMIIIEDFDKIDSSSFEIMRYIFKAFEQLDVSYLLTYDKDYSLHSHCHFLLEKPYYTEIYLKPTPFEKMIEEHKNYYRNIMDSFYFHRIAKYACGSILYIDIAIQYLIECGVFEAKEDCIDLVNPETIIIPSSLDKLVARRLNLLQDDEMAIKFLTEVVLLGTRIDVATIESLEIEGIEDVLNKLQDMGFVYFYNNCLYFPNYNLLRRNLLVTISPIYLQELAKDLLDKVFVENMPSQTKTFLYDLLKMPEKALEEWQDLAEINLSVGDFSSYLNCSHKVIEYLDTLVNDENAEQIEQQKLEIYGNISDNMFEYQPEKTGEIALATLQELERTTNTEKIIVLCNKMIQGYLITGDYMHALELMHKVLTLLPTSSLSPSLPNFNSYFYMMSVIHIQILFNIGAYNECMEIGYKVLNELSDAAMPTLKPEQYSMEEFSGIMTDTIAYVALSNILSLNGNVQEFLQIAGADYTQIPASYSVFIALESLIHGGEVDVNNIQPAPNDKFSPVLIHLINAFSNCKNNPEAFAEEIYMAKLFARDRDLFGLEYFCDLMVGYAYLQLKNYTKADDIIYKVIKAANHSGMTALLYVAWYLMCELKLALGKYDVAYGIVNNSMIQLQKSDSACEYLMLLFKYAMFKVFMYKQDFEKAEICIQQAQYLADKWQIRFEFDMNQEHYIPMDYSDAENQDLEGNMNELLSENEEEQ